MAGIDHLRHNHIVLFPFPEQGHINPMLQLALHLASAGSSVTFIRTLRTQQKLPFYGSPSHPLIRFASIPDGLTLDDSHEVTIVIPPSLHSPSRISFTAMPGLFRSFPEQAPHLEKLLSDLEVPPSCFVSDYFCGWTEPISRKLKIAWIAFSSSSATQLCSTMLAVQQHGGAETATEVPGFPHLTNHVASVFFKCSDHFRDFIRSQIETISRADLVLCNTFQEIERESIEYLASRIPFRAVGPLCVGAEAAHRLGSMKEPNEDCLPWLDRQSAKSVLYVSFGSKVSPGEEAIEKIGAGIEATGRPCLWVLRKGNSAQMEMATKKVPSNWKVVSWAEQEKVLAHPSIGAFLSHCGWNSVLEAVTQAVPLLCWPVFGDQLVNRALVEEEWRVGKGLDGHSHVEDIRAAIEEVMDDQKIRQQAENLRQTAIDAARMGGFRSLISHMDGSNPIWLWWLFRNCRSCWNILLMISRLVVRSIHTFCFRDILKVYQLPGLIVNRCRGLT